MPSHYLNQCWVFVKWTLRNKLQWNFNLKTKFPFAKMHLKILSVKWPPFCLGGDELMVNPGCRHHQAWYWKLSILLHFFYYVDVHNFSLCIVGNKGIWIYCMVSLDCFTESMPLSPHTGNFHLLWHFQSIDMYACLIYSILGWQNYISLICSHTIILAKTVLIRTVKYLTAIISNNSFLFQGVELDDFTSVLDKQD